MRFEIILGTAAVAVKGPPLVHTRVKTQHSPQCVLSQGELSFQMSIAAAAECCFDIVVVATLDLSEGIFFWLARGGGTDYRDPCPPKYATGPGVRTSLPRPRPVVVGNAH